MAAAASQNTGWAIRRVSLKNRNPKAVPDAWEQAVLEDFDRRRAIAVDRTEVTLAIHQHVTQRKILRHTDDRVINGRIAVGVVLTDHVTDNTGRFLVRFIPVVAQLVHRK